MTYAQLITYIAQWIYENNNREITATTLRDVLNAMAAFSNDVGNDADDNISDLQAQIDLIEISQGAIVHEGEFDNPNIDPPVDKPVNPGDVYVSALNSIWFYNGDEWVNYNATERNAIVVEKIIPEGETATDVVDYVNSQNPSFEKGADETYVFKADGNYFLLINRGKGRLGSENPIDESNLIQLNGGGGGGNPTYTDDIPVILSSGKSLGRYTNGQTIPAAGKTMQEVMELIAQEYLAPSITAFAINQTSPIEVGTVISGNKNFTFSFSNSGNVEQNSVKIIDGITNTVLAENLPKSSPQSVDIGTIVKLETDSHVWRIEAKNTQGATISRNSSPVTWLFRWFFGGSDTDIVTSSQARALSDSVFSTGGAKQFVAGTAHTDFYFLIHDEAAIYSVTDLTALNADITSAYVLQGTMTVNDIGGNPQTYKKYKLSLASAYTSPHTHEFIISYPQ